MQLCAATLQPRCTANQRPACTLAAPTEAAAPVANHTADAPSSIKAASASTHLVLHSLPCKLRLHEQRVGGGHGKRAERDREQRQVGGAPHAGAAGQRTAECQAVGDVRSCELEAGVL